MYNIFTQTMDIWHKDAKKVADYLINKRYGDKLPKSVQEIITALSTPAVSADKAQIETAANAVIAANPKAVADYQAGKQQALFFLIGQVKKELGSVDTQLTKSILEKLI